MKREMLKPTAALESDAHPDPRIALLQALNTQLIAADALHLDIVAIRISEAIDQLVEELGFDIQEGRAN